MNILKTYHLTKRYNEQIAVDQVTMTIKQGDIYGFVGENGAGKTTVIRMISGLIFPSEGSFTLFEGQSSIGQLGAIVETPSIHPYFTAIDNLKQAFILVGRKDFESIPKLLDSVGLSYMISDRKKAKNFSLGMKQRLGIAIALASNPKFLILDEPMNGLDPEGIVDMRNMILKLNKELGITFLISSHLLTELSKVVNRYGFIHKGRLIEEITSDELDAKLVKKTILKLNHTAHISEVLNFLKIKNHRVINDTTIEIQDEIVLSKLITELSKKDFEVLNVTQSSAGIEDYYLTLIGGKSHA